MSDAGPDGRNDGMTVSLSAFGRSLISRERGAMVRNDVLGRLGGDRRVVLDFTDVRRASYSFVDELVGELFTLKRNGELIEVAVVGPSETVAYHVAQCRLRRVRADESAARVHRIVKEDHEILERLA